MVTYIPTRETFDGSDATGSDGGSNRTITVSQSTASVFTNVIVDGTSLHQGAGKDYTISTNVVTFLNALFDTSSIDISYTYTSTTTTSTTTSDLKYTTTEKFNRFLQSNLFMPDYPVSTTKENVGTGDTTTTVFYLDKKGAIDSTETLITGSIAESGSTTTLVKDTHYEINYDISRITLTATGLASVASTSIFADYQYNKFSIIDSMLKDNLVRAEAMVDTMVNTVFADGTANTPGYTTVTNELQTGQGRYNRVYNTDKYPLNSSTAILSGAIGASTTTITVDSTNGFPSSGVAATSTQKFSYTAKTTSTFTGVTNLTASVADGTTVTSYVVERSLDSEGTSPSFTVMQTNTDYSIDTLSGEVKLTNTNINNTIILDNFHPAATVWDRVRLSYQHGYDTIPEEVVRAVHLIAGKNMFQGQVLNALSRGTNGFQTQSEQDIDNTINKIINKYKCWLIKSTKQQ